MFETLTFGGLAILDRQENSTQIQADSVSDNLSKNVVIKKPFVEPEISVPIDVLEATTFQQPVTSGATN
jgi:hypothetical protein